MTEQKKHNQAVLHPSELVTLGMLFALKGVGNRAFYRWAEEPRLLSLGRRTAPSIAGQKQTLPRSFPAYLSAHACFACWRRIKTGRRAF